KAEVRVDIGLASAVIELYNHYADPFGQIQAAARRRQNNARLPTLRHLVPSLRISPFCPPKIAEFWVCTGSGSAEAPLFCHIGAFGTAEQFCFSRRIEAALCALCAAPTIGEIACESVEHPCASFECGVRDTVRISRSR